MKQFVFINRGTGMLGCGIRFSKFDNEDDVLLDNLEGYRVALSKTEPDAWAIQCSETEPWIMVAPDMLTALENLGEL